MTQLEAAALSWWKSKRPEGWSSIGHIAESAVNCSTDEERKLAKEAAALALELRMHDIWNKRTPEA